MNLLYAFDLAGTFTFAISGILTVREKEQDWLGATFTGFITAIGGGSLRDILLGSYPLTWVGDTSYLHVILLAVPITYMFYYQLEKLKRTLLLFDTMGIAFFTLVGTKKALDVGVAPEVAAIMGMFSAIMGGVIRDTLINDTPILYRKEIYASACLAGAITFLSLNSLGVNYNINFVVSLILIISIRILAVKYNLQLPQFKR
ncbi:trimeric intracellular cation channel family protein [Rapidithrix thailandica]|uniref:Trimeric intracellular cation channel family protein n=1 Tax=Rapidithrix thailandica TaxID=413964 RepID=A0AAW9RTV0_9BACT